MSWTRFFALALALTAGCSEREGKVEVDEANASRAPLDENQAMMAQTAASTESLDDAVGWSESIKVYWSDLASRLKEPAPEGSENSGGKSEVLIQEERPTERQTVFEEPSMRIYEWGGLNADAVKRVSGGVSTAQWASFWRSELSLIGEGPAKPFVKFKVTGLEQVGEQTWRTEQKVKARGVADGQKVWTELDMSASWSVRGTEDLSLSEVVIHRIRRIEIPADSASWFDDMAPALLRDEPAWSGQLAEGMNAWVRRLDKALRPDFLGYHGLAVNDVNGDGLEDVYLCQPGGLPNLLLLQQTDGRMRDVGAAAGVDWLENTTSALLVDLDNDGDPDLALATQRGFFIMENDGSGKFGQRARLTQLANGYSPSAADVDNDGDLDLLVLRYGSATREVGDFPTPHPFYDARNGGANVLLENAGGFRFQDVTAARGLSEGNHRFSFAATWEDYDNDGDLDLYVANDFGPNQFYRNDSGRLVDVSTESQTRDWGFGMSASWGDYDRDGRMDLYVSSMFSGAGNQVVPLNPLIRGDVGEKYRKMVRGNTLLRNRGDGGFDDVTDLKSEGFAGWAWGAPFVDLNNDGWEDLYVANGYVSQPDTDDL